MSYWQISRGDWKIKKPASFLSHLQAGILIAVIPVLILEHPSTEVWRIWGWVRHPLTWFAVGILSGIAWEWGYYWIVAKVLPQAPKIEWEYGQHGWPIIGRHWEPRITHAILKGYDSGNQVRYQGEGAVEFLLESAPDRALPRAFDLVPFVLGAALGLWFTVWGVGG